MIVVVSATVVHVDGRDVVVDCTIKDVVVVGVAVVVDVVLVEQQKHARHVARNLLSSYDVFTSLANSLAVLLVYLSSFLLILLPMYWVINNEQLHNYFHTSFFTPP